VEKGLTSRDHSKNIVIPGAVQHDSDAPLTQDPFRRHDGSRIAAFAASGMTDFLD